MLDWGDKSAVDAAVKDVIRQEDRPTRASFIVATLESEHGADVRIFRGVDSSLQRLRKRKEIRLQSGPGGGWLIEHPATVVK